MVAPKHFTPHPEGGRYAEVFRSPRQVQSVTGERRAATTHIYFELQAGEMSCFHAVASDEIWNLYEGVLKLWTWDARTDELSSVVLTPQTRNYCHIVSAGSWQAAEPVEAPVLVGCSVAPGFEFSDFQLLRTQSELAARLMARQPSLTHLL